MSPSFMGGTCWGPNSKGKGESTNTHLTIMHDLRSQDWDGSEGLVIWLCPPSKISIPLKSDVGYKKVFMVLCVVLDLKNT